MINRFLNLLVVFFKTQADVMSRSLHEICWAVFKFKRIVENLGFEPYLTNYEFKNQSNDTRKSYIFSKYHFW